MSVKSDLLKLFNNLTDIDQLSLLEFAEFLEYKATLKPKEKIPVPPLKNIPRPEKESVFKAIKRLSECYYMINKDKLMNETSNLMMEHTLRGKSAEAVIDELEALFENHYQKLLDEQRLDGQNICDEGNV